MRTGLLPIFALMTLIGFTRPGLAQQPTPMSVTAGSWQGAYVPVVINDPAVGDPYATVAARSQFPLLNGQPILPTSQTFADRLWLRGEYLHWWTDGMRTPAIVTTSPNGTAQSTAAVLGEPGTSILFGGNEINDSSVGGIRAKAGFWITPQAAFGIEAEYFHLDDQNDGYYGESDGSTIIGRPFFDITNGRETAQLISYPGLVSGNIRVTSDTDLDSLLINGRAALCPTHGPRCDQYAQADRVDWIVGYRYLDLDDRISFSENLNSLVTTAPGTVSIQETFRTSNEFHGLQLGIVHQSNFRRAWLETMLRVAVGNNTQNVSIAGGTSITEAGITDTFNGGLFAQRTNNGNYERDVFTMIPEIGLTFGIRVTDWFHATLGYSVLYYPNVVRASEQISTDVNPNLLAPEANPFTGALRPRFQYRESDYWAQGLSIGGELRF